ncbi:hypothetical protein GCM10027082_36690 [Comamonas humi]
MLLSLAAALALTLASLVAVLATERAASRITGPRGWCLALLLIGLAIFLLLRPQAGPEAVAMATVGLMAAIPLIATLVGWRQRREASDGRR